MSLSLSTATPSHTTPIPSLANRLSAHMPARWVGDSSAEYTYIFLPDDISMQDFSALHQGLSQSLWPNPRVFTPTAFGLSSLFHPLFFASIQRNDACVWTPHPGLRLTLPISPSLPVVSAEFWLQSMLFLAGVTLSAAIIQNRWSPGTFESKLARLWQAGSVAARHSIEALQPLNLCDQVQHLAQLNTTPLEKFLSLKHIYAHALSQLVQAIPHTTIRMKPSPLTASQHSRFGFINDLRTQLGDQLLAVLVYGSSINSDSFADYDLMLVVKDSETVLRLLANTSPCHQGKELNIGVYNEQDFWTYQLASGDNLPDYALCLYGEIDVPLKERNDLIARNFSFGFVRMRQLIGMAAYAARQSLVASTDDKRNLFQYFIKIPLNVVKGIQGVLDSPMPKERVNEWCIEHIGFDMAYQNTVCQQGKAASAIASAAWATERVLVEYNHKLKVYAPPLENKISHTNNNTQ